VERGRLTGAGRAADGRVALGTCLRVARDDRGAVDISSVLTGIIIFAVVGAVVGGVYLSIVNSSKDTGPKAAAQTAQTLVEACYVTTQTYQLCTSQAALESGTPSGLSWGTAAADSGTVNVTNGGSTDGYTINSAGTTNGTVFTIHRVPITGVIQRTCAPRTTGGCAASGNW
jgi:hypothetical protein